MIGKEIYRILSRNRKLMLLALAVTVAFLIYYGSVSIWEEAVVDDGRVYRYREAVAYDKMIAEEFTGPLTEETVRAVWEKYGPPVRYYGNEGNLEDALLSEEGDYDNFCNSFVTQRFAEVVEQEDGTRLLVLPEDLSESRFLDGSYVFGYAGGWIWYWDRLFLAQIMAALMVIIGFCPIYSEDYAFRTADVILPTVKGGLRLWRTRTAAGFLFGSVCYWLVSGIVFLQNYWLYGSEGLSVSCGLTFIPYFFPEGSDPMWKAVLLLHLGGWFAVLALVLQIQAVSARCRSSFGSLLWSLVVYLGPFALIRMVLDNLPSTVWNRWLQHICYSMPLSFPAMYAQSPPLAKRILLIFVLIAAVLAAVLGAVRWCRHQVRN